MNLSNVCQGDFTTIPQELFDFARRQVVNALMYKGDERRREGRHPMVVPVRMVAINDEHQATDEPFQVVTRDVSSNSIGLIHLDEITGEHFAIHLSLAQTEVIMAIELTWTGELGPFYGAAGRYVQRLEQFPRCW